MAIPRTAIRKRPHSAGLSAPWRRPTASEALSFLFRLLSRPRTPPPPQYRLHIRRDPPPRLMPRHPAHQQRVVRRVHMPHGRHHRRHHRPLRQRPPRRTPPHPPAAPQGRMRGDDSGAVTRAPGKPPPYLRRERLREPHVRHRPPPSVPRPTPSPCLRVREAPLLGPHQPGLLDEDALPLVTPLAPVETHDDRRQRTLLPRPTRERRVAARKEHQMPEVGTVETPRRPALDDEQRQRPAPALRTVPSPQRLDNEGSATRRGSHKTCHEGFIPQAPLTTDTTSSKCGADGGAAERQSGRTENARCSPSAPPPRLERHRPPVPARRPPDP